MPENLTILPEFSDDYLRRIKMKKRIFSILLVLCLAMTSLPSYAVSASPQPEPVPAENVTADADQGNHADSGTASDETVSGTADSADDSADSEAVLGAGVTGILKFASKYVSKVVLTNVTREILSSDNQALKEVFMFFTNKLTDPAVTLCKEILKKVTAIEAEVNNSKVYLSDMVAQFETNVNAQHLSDVSTKMNTTMQPVETALTQYHVYITAANDYANNPVPSKETTMNLEKQTLMDDLDAIQKSGFRNLLSTYVLYVSTEKATYGDVAPQTNTDKTYLYWLDQLCDNVYAFDYQKYNAMCAGINWNASQIQECLQAENIFITLKEDAGASDADLASYKSEYEKCTEIATNALNNVATQYGASLDNMVRSYDLNTQENMYYRTTADNKLQVNYYTLFSGGLQEINYSAALADLSGSEDICSSPSMYFYRVGSSNGQGVYLILKQAPGQYDSASDQFNTIKGSYLFQNVHVDLRFMGFPNDIDVFSPSMEWLNLLSTQNGNYSNIKSLSQLKALTSPLSYDASGSNLLSFIRDTGGLKAFSGFTDSNMPMLFLDSTKPAEYHPWSDDMFNTEFSMKASWAQMNGMGKTANGVDSNCLKDVEDASDTNKMNPVLKQNTMVILSQNSDPSNTVTSQVQGYGTMNVAVDGKNISSGASVQARKELAITVKPNSENYTLDSLKITGVQKPYLDSKYTDPDSSSYKSGLTLNETLAENGDFEYRTKNSDGSVTFYFNMPFQACTITASFTKAVYEQSFALGIEKTGEGSGDVALTDEAGASLMGTSGTGAAQFGELVNITATPSDGCEVGSVKLKDASGNVLLTLSALTNTNFVMPSQDCTVSVEFAKKSEDTSDFYLIPDYQTLLDYQSKMNSTDRTERTKYLSAHYRVTADFSCGDGTQEAIRQMDYHESFKGTFDGQGHVISNLHLQRGLFTTIDSTALVCNLVLSGCVSDTPDGILALNNNGTVNHFELKNSNFTSNQETCGVVNYNKGTIINCGVDNTVSLAGRYVAGYCRNSTGTIANSYCTAKCLKVVNGGSGYLLSGFANSIGYNSSSDTSQGRIDNCYAAFDYDFNAVGVASIENVGCFATKDRGNLTNCIASYIDIAFDAADPDIKALPAPQMMQDSFKDTLNSHLQSYYMNWQRSSDVNGGYPTFSGQGSSMYSVSQKVVGSGSIVLTRANGGAISHGAMPGETINVEVQALDGAPLQSLRYVSAHDESKFYGDIDTSFIMPSDDIMVEATFLNLDSEVPISTDIEGVGEISIKNDAGSDITSAKKNSTVHLKAASGVGYSLQSWELRDYARGTVLQTFSGTETTFSMPGEHCTVHAVFVKGTPSVTVSSKTTGTGSGTISMTKADGSAVSSGTSLPVNTVMSAVVKPDGNSYPAGISLMDESGNVLSNILDDYQKYLDLKQADGSYLVSFTVPSVNCILQADFEAQAPSLYTVSGQKMGEGSMRGGLVSGNASDGMVPAGSVVWVAAVAKDTTNGKVSKLELQDEKGNVLQDLLQSSDNLKASASEGSVYVTFTMPAEDVIVKAVFGSASDPDGQDAYLISSYQDLLNAASNIQKDPDTYAGATYQVTQDIDCASGGVSQPWTLPIGTADHPFTGTWEGNDMTIEHLSVSSSGDSMGLFGVIGKGGIVRHLSVLGLVWQGDTKYAGGIAAVNMGTINFCSSGINIGSTGDESGHIDSDTIFADLQSTIRGSDTAGGICAVNKGLIANSRNNSLVLDAGVSGGIAGVNSGTIANFYNIGHVFGKTKEGGAAGSNSGTIAFGYNAFKLEGDGASLTGQIVGESSSAALSNVFYNAENMTASGGSGDEAFSYAAYKPDSEIKSSAFADLLNTASAGHDLGTWIYESSKNFGYPRIQAAVLTQKTYTSKNGIKVTGMVHPDANLEISALSGSSSDYQALRSAASGGDLISAYDISLRFADGRRATFEGDLTIEIPVDQANRLRTLKTLHLHNGNMEIINDGINADGMLQFTVRNLSAFGIAAYGVIPATVNAAPDTQNTSTGTVAVRTGDTQNWAYPLLLMAAAAGIMFVCLRKKKKGRREGGNE